VSTVFAAPQAATVTHGVGVGGLAQVTVALLVVLGAVFLLAWLLRRLRVGSGRLGSALDVLAHVPLGQKERAVLLKVGGTQILLGVAPGRVNALYVLPEPLELAPRTLPSATPETVSFRALLLKSLGK
jgi:flagellar protein FliO/FliZ